MHPDSPKMSNGDLEEARSEASLPCSAESDGLPEALGLPRGRATLTRSKLAPALTRTFSK